jgi:ABC-type sugar transport system substrate-binding protein
MKRLASSFWARPLVVGWLLLGLGGCGARGVPGPAGAVAAQAPPVDPARRPGKRLILVAMPDSAAFRSVRRSFVEEVKADFDVVTTVVDARTTSASFGAEIDRQQPTCVVLMDNPTVRLFRAYQKGKQGPPLPALVVMASFLEEVRGELANATGVTYEVPGVSAFVNLRSVIERPVNRVGVVHRPSFRGFIERQKGLAAREQVTLVSAEVPADASVADVRRALRSLRSSGNIDALWVLNDNALLRDARVLEQAWRPEIARMGVPVVVGVSTLVSDEARFGTFAVLPDLEALGVQAANVLFEVSDSGWNASAHPVELPVSTVTVVNMRQVRGQFGLRAGATRRIDKGIE